MSRITPPPAPTIPTNRILLKRSLIGGVVPSLYELDEGELAINVADGKLFLHKHDDLGVASIIEIGTQTAASIQQAVGFPLLSADAVNVPSGVAGLDINGKLLSSQIPDSLVGALQFQGTWNVAANIPALASGVGVKGQYYKVSTAGTRALDGNSQWNLGDTVVFDGTVWDKIDGLSSEVLSVGGFTGDITKVQLAIDQLNNTSDANKPVSTAQQTALNLKLDASKLGVANGAASLDASGKLTTAQIPAALVGALQYQGTWNPLTNTPALTSGVGTKGQYYKLSAAQPLSTPFSTTLYTDIATPDNVGGTNYIVLMNSVADVQVGYTVTIRGHSAHVTQVNAGTKTLNLDAYLVTHPSDSALITNGVVALDGMTQFNIGDLVVFNGTTWDKIDGLSSEVTSVAGRVGAVVLAAADVSGLAASATTDTTNATNISSGTLPVARVPGLPFSIITSGKPTTLAGYGIADAVASTLVGAANGVASLDATGKLTSAQIPASLLGAMQYQGVWNPTTNTPALAGGVGTKGQYYKVSTAGALPPFTLNTTGTSDLSVVNYITVPSTAGVKPGMTVTFRGNSYTVTSTTSNAIYFSGLASATNGMTVVITGTSTLDGITQFNVGDMVVFDGTTWDKIDGLASEVTTVAGRVGAVVLAAADVSGLAASATVDATNASNITTGLLPVGRLPALTGDATAAAGTGALTLASVATAGTFPKVTFDAKGRVLSGAALVAADIPNLDYSKITTGKPTTLSGYGITDAVAAALVGAANGLATLDASGRLTNAQIPAALVGALQYQGVWDASANTPALVSSTGTKGQYYKVSVAGATSLDSITQWNVGDMVVFDGTTWDKIDGLSSEVTSVFGRVGAVTLLASDVPNLDYSKITTGKPTTVAGYGITDAYTKTQTDAAIAAATPTFASLTGKPTTLLGYGITDAAKSGVNSDITSLTALTTAKIGELTITQVSTAVPTAAAVVVDSFSAATYRTARFEISVMDAAGSFHATTFKMVHDGTTVYSTEYGEITSAGALGTFDAAIVGGVVQLTFTPGAASTKTVKIARYGMAA